MTPSTVATWALNGVTVEFDVPFDYLSQTYVKVTLIGTTNTRLVLGTDYTFLTPTRIRLFAAYGPPAYNLIEVRRETSTTEKLVEFQDASILTADDMNTADLQVMHVAEEARNAATETIGVNNEGNLDARGRRIVNAANPVEPLDVVNKLHFDTAVGGLGEARIAAEAARDKAREWATKATPVEASMESSKTYAERSKASEGVATSNASSAAQSASTASTKATEAAGSATLAGQHKDASKVNADNAKASETAAAASAAAAATFEPSKFVPQTSPTGVATLPTNSSEAPGGAAQIRYNDIKKRVEYWNGIAWSALGGGGSILEYTWHNGPRSSIVGGSVACDGQMITQLQYPDTYAAVVAGKQFSVPDATWQADPMQRNKWGVGDGWVRVPDLNGVHPGSEHAFYLRGSPAARSGQSVGDAIRDIAGTFQTVAQDTPTGAFELINTIGGQWAGTGQFYRYIRFRASAVVPTADENRVKSAYGVWCVRVATEVTNDGSVDVLQLATQVDNLTQRMVKVEGGSAILPYSSGNIDFTGIPAGATEVAVDFLGLIQSNTTLYPLIQLGNAAGMLPDGSYRGHLTVSLSTNRVSSYVTSSGIPLPTYASSEGTVGRVLLVRAPADKWFASGALGGMNETHAFTASTGTLVSGGLTRVRITSLTNSFSAGHVKVSWK